MNTDLDMLLSFMFLLAVIAGVAWGFMTRPLRIAPKASIRFFFANLFLATGVYLLNMQSEATALLRWFLSDLALLSSFMLTGWGIQHLFKLKSTVKRDSLLFAIASILMLVGQLQQMHPMLLGLVFSATASLFFYSACKHNYIALRRDFDIAVAALMSAPLFITTMIFVCRSVLFALPISSNFAALTTSKAGAPLLWVGVILILAMNIVMIGGALARLVAKIRLFAERDQLTGLWNRRAILKKLQDLHEQWQKHQQIYSLILLDLDHFKQINDRLGHDAGDEALRHCAITLTSVMREQDLISRYGGEEFLLLFPGVTAQELPGIAEKVRKSLAHSHLFWRGDQIEISASLGYITVYPGAKAVQLLTLADTAMYQAKAEGRNRSHAAIVPPPSTP